MPASPSDSTRARAHRVEARERGIEPARELEVVSEIAYMDDGFSLSALSGIGDA